MRVLNGAGLAALATCLALPAGVIPEGDDTPIRWNWVEDRGNLLELSPDVCRCRPKVHYPPFWVPP